MTYLDVKIRETERRMLGVRLGKGGGGWGIIIEWIQPFSFIMKRVIELNVGDACIISCM